MSHVIVLGDPETAERRNVLRDETLEVRSRHGLRGTERLLIEALPPKAPKRVLCGLDSEAAVALAARALWGEGVEIVYWHLDSYVSDQARRNLARAEVDPDVPVVCATDLPGSWAPGEPQPEDPVPFDLIVLPATQNTPTILIRELCEEAHRILSPKGRLILSTESSTGNTVKRILHDVFGNHAVLHGRKKIGWAVVGRKTKPLRERDHRHPIRAEGRGRTLELESRPGIFGHERLDAGTKSLLDAFQLHAGDRVLDLGCGYGPLTIAAAQELDALEAETPSETPGRVVGVDSSTRAVAQTLRNAARNGLEARVHALPWARPLDLGEDPFDVVLTNPPYFANFRIAREFVAIAARVLRPGGSLWLVAKAIDAHADLLADGWRIESIESYERGYGVLHAVRRGRADA